MSYDLRIAVKVEGAEKDNEFAIIAEPERNNPTYNLGEMFRACTGWDFKQSEFYKVSDVYQNIVRGIVNLTEHEDEFEKYNPPNGWGTTQSALAALKSLKECIDDIEDPHSWSGWNTFPKELRYVAWCKERR
jgi:hypothetical protein